MNTSTQALEKVIADRIEEVKLWMAEGMTKEWSLAHVKKSSTLGQQAWASVENAV